MHETALHEVSVWPGTGDGGGGAPGALAELDLGGGRRVRARLVVGADGPRSHVRQLAGAPCVHEFARSRKFQEACLLARPPFFCYM